MSGADREIVLWLNQWAGRWEVLDDAARLAANDYLIPVALALGLLGLWFWGKDAETRAKRQYAVLRAVIALGFANLAMLVFNDFYFRTRPFNDLDLRLLFYEPTDSSFPANASALSFAVAFSVWLAIRPVGWAVLAAAALWSLSRVFAGAHYLSDVVGGGVIGVASAAAVWWGLPRMEPLPTVVVRVARALRLA
ncbi:MAG: phosphatase PAP2 family protein [SAR202 cluster bacterium]|nr:phosphatase PAP2 family protein [SAR202 cluster bacterium]